MVKPCPYPEKKRYASKRAARRGRVGIYENRADGGGQLVAFRCGDHWHVGHRSRESWRDRRR